MLSYLDSELKFALDKGAYFPTIAHYKEDAGIDLKTPVDVVIPAGGSAEINTGVHVSLPSHTFGKLESKSGLNIKHQVVCLGGVVDEGYTGPIVTRLYNLSDKDYHFKKGDKIVQMVIIPVAYAESLTEVSLDKLKKISSGKRGDDGFGSTGK